jgi:hypothetical protein
MSENWDYSPISSIVTCSFICSEASNDYFMFVVTMTEIARARSIVVPMHDFDHERERCDVLGDRE